VLAKQELHFNMAGDADPSERSLEFSPTWALATVATVFVVTSFVVERLLHWLGHVCVECSFPHPLKQCVICEAGLSYQLSPNDLLH